MCLLLDSGRTSSWHSVHFKATLLSFFSSAHLSAFHLRRAWSLASSISTRMSICVPSESSSKFSGRLYCSAVIVQVFAKLCTGPRGPAACNDPGPRARSGSCVSVYFTRCFPLCLCRIIDLYELNGFPLKQSWHVSSATWFSRRCRAVSSPVRRNNSQNLHSLKFL